MVVVRHLELEFLSLWTTHKVRFDYPVIIWCRSDVRHRRFYDFASWGLNPLKFCVVINTPKRHILG